MNEAASQIVTNVFSVMVLATFDVIFWFAGFGFLVFGVFTLYRRVQIEGVKIISLSLAFLAVGAGSDYAYMSLIGERSDIGAALTSTFYASCFFGFAFGFFKFAKALGASTPSAPGQ